jgi:MFS family permease
VFSFVASAGASIGLLAGGVITQVLSWHWIFFVNLPIGVATGVLAVRLVSNDVGIGLRKGADVPGATLITGALMLAVYTIVKASDYGWGSAHTIGFGAAAILFLVGFVVRESTAKTPLVPLAIFRSRNVAGANIAQMLMVSGIFGMFFLGAVYMQRVLGYGPLEVGLAFLPVALAIGVLSLNITPKLNMRFGGRTTLVPGLLLISLGLVLFALAPVHAGYFANLLVVMVLLGVGAGLSFPSLMTIAMSGVTPSEAGLASGLVNTSLQVGGALGLAVLATLSSTRTKDLLHTGSSQADALTSGLHLALVIGSILVAIAVVLALVILERAPAAQHQEAIDVEPAYSEAA